MNDFLLRTILTIPAMLIALTFQGYAKAYMAYRLGDKSQKFKGRLTTNPLAHIDPIGFIMLLVVHFGWSKTIDIDTRSLKNYKKDMLKISLSAPIANFLVAVVFSVIYGLLYRFQPQNINSIMIVLIAVCANIIRLNVFLGLFDLLPLPGLDGFKILECIYPNTFYKIADKLYQYQMIIMMVILLGGARFLSIPANMIMDLLIKFITMPIVNL